MTEAEEVLAAIEGIGCRCILLTKTTAGAGLLRSLLDSDTICDFQNQIEAIGRENDTIYYADKRDVFPPEIYGEKPWRGRWG